MTPIFDLECPPPMPGSNRRILFVCVAVGAAIGLAAGLTKATVAVPFDWFPGLNGPAFLLAVYVAIGIHEAAHLLVGKAAGFRSGGMGIGGFHVMKSGERWVFRFQLRSLFCGFVRPLPKRGQCGRGSFAWMISAGPLSSIVLFSIAAAVWLRYRNGSGDWAASFFWGALLVAVLACIPSSKGVNRSDVSRLRQLLRDPEGFRSWMALLALAAQETDGVRPRDWDADLFQTMLERNGSEAENAYRSLLAYYRFVDLGAQEAALQSLEYALRGSVRLRATLRSTLFLEAAFASAMFRRNPDQARTWVARAMKISKPENDNSVNGALAMCEGRFEEAIHYFKQAIVYIEDRGLDSGLARFAKAKYAEYQDECRVLLDGRVSRR